jgi:hypothetical protein
VPFFLAGNNVATNGEELSTYIDAECTEYFCGLLELREPRRERERVRKEEKEVKQDGERQKERKH